MKRFLALAILSGTLALSLQPAAVSAQTGQQQQPAEFPPASYKGKQYVDSQGCVFIRAGIDGDVSWIPRVTRSRKVICGFKPSLSGAAAAAAPEVRPETDEEVVVAVEDAPAVVRAPVAKPVPAPAVRRRAATPRPVVPAAAPARPRVADPIPLAPVTDTACPNASPRAQAYLRKGKQAVRCGPQTAPIVGLQGRGIATNAVPVATAVGGVTQETRLLPRHVAVQRAESSDVQIPDGYKRVWTDGRLNPRRGEQNLRGIGQMALIWSDTVPRRLIDRRTGRDVTAQVPLVYPFTSFARQDAELGQVTIVQLDGKVVKRILRSPGEAPQERAPVISSRSAPKAVAAKPAARAAVQVVGKDRYIQIGTYRRADTAQKAARQIARMGLPARIGTRRKGLTTVRTVQAGPFTQGAALQRAIGALRKAGYGDAFVKK